MDMDTDRYRRHLIRLTSAFFLLCLTWAISLPYFDGPDEIHHHNSVVRVARGLGWPRPYEAKMLGSTHHTRTEAQPPEPEAGSPVSRPPATRRARLVDPGPHEDHTRDHMVQHPPGFYLLAAAPLKLVGVGSIRWDTAALLMRIVSALTLTAALPFIVGTVSRLTGHRLAGLLGGTSLVGIPFFSNMGGYVTNDNLLIATGAAALYGATRIAVEPDAPRWLPAATGAALGLALFTKGYALLLIPAIVILSVLAIVRRPSGERSSLIGRLGIGAMLTVALGGWWWIRNLVVLGRLQPSQLARVHVGKPVHPDYSLTSFLRGSADRIQATFWGRGARASIAYPSSLTWIATIGLVIVILAGVYLARRRLETVVLATVPVLLAASFLANAHRIYRVLVDSRNGIRGVQGRYLFSGIVVVAVCVGWVAVSARRRIGPARARWIAPAALTAPWLVAVGGLVWTVARHPATRWRPTFAADLHEQFGMPVAWIIPVLCMGLVVWTAVVIGREIESATGASGEPPSDREPAVL